MGKKQARKFLNLPCIFTLFRRIFYKLSLTTQRTAFSNMTKRESQLSFLRTRACAVLYQSYKAQGSEGFTQLCCVWIMKDTLKFPVRLTYEV